MADIIKTSIRANGYNNWCADCGNEINPNATGKAYIAIRINADNSEDVLHRACAS